MAVLYPDCRQDDTWGACSHYVLRSALANPEPLFILHERRPVAPSAYHVLPPAGFAAVRGLWIVADLYGDGGTCDDNH